MKTLHLVLSIIVEECNQQTFAGYRTYSISIVSIEISFNRSIVVFYLYWIHIQFHEQRSQNKIEWREANAYN